MQLDPQVQVIVDEINAVEVESLWDRPIADVRADFDSLVLGLQEQGPEVGRVENRDIPGPHGPIPIRIYWPKGSDAATPLPVYINYHGSGYVDPAQAKRPGHQTGADYLLSGSLSSNVQQVGGDKLVYYKATFSVTDLLTSEIVWTDEKEIRKAYKKRSVGL